MSFAIPVVAGALLLAACGSGSSSSSSSSSSGASAASSGTSSPASVKTAADAALGGSVLVDSQGMTLYRLTAETNGKFICTGPCLQVWHPLTAPGGTRPSGTVPSLATVTRPDGTAQVTFKGQPLYTFVKDKKPGDATGQGIKDVGMWTAVRASARASSTPASTPPATTTQAPVSPPASGGGGGY
ncbi:MAG: COG4315 family predicted lipoprotein [Solirubrobacteraceae bacterium]